MVTCLVFYVYKASIGSYGCLPIDQAHFSLGHTNENETMRTSTERDDYPSAKVPNLKLFSVSIRISSSLGGFWLQKGQLKFLCSCLLKKSHY